MSEMVDRRTFHCETEDETGAPIRLLRFTFFLFSEVLKSNLYLPLQKYSTKKSNLNLTGFDYKTSVWFRDFFTLFETRQKPNSLANLNPPPLYYNSIPSGPLRNVGMKILHTEFLLKKTLWHHATFKTFCHVFVSPSQNWVLKRRQAIYITAKLIAVFSLLCNRQYLCRRVWI